MLDDNPKVCETNPLMDGCICDPLTWDHWSVLCTNRLGLTLPESDLSLRVIDIVIIGYVDKCIKAMVDWFEIHHSQLG